MGLPEVIYTPSTRTGVVAVKNTEITEDDIERVIEAAKAVVIPSNREILHVIPQEYKVDNSAGIKNPIGMWVLG